MLTKFELTDQEKVALEVLFALAEKDTGGGARARKLLCAWWNATELGGFDFTDLWSFDPPHLKAATVVIALIARAPVGTYADSFVGERARMLALHRVRELDIVTSESVQGP